MFRIGIARVSTKTQQRSGNSLSEQIQRLKQYDPNMLILEFAQSAYNKSIFPHILKHIKENTEIVVLYSDRLSRNVTDCTEFIAKQLEPRNSYIYSITENIKTNTKTGKLEFIKKIVDGETLSHNIGQRVKDGLKHRIQIKKSKYGVNSYEKGNIKIIMDLYNDKLKSANILKFLKDNNISKYNINNEHNNNNSSSSGNSSSSSSSNNNNSNNSSNVIDYNNRYHRWSINFIQNIIKENKNSSYYKNNFNFNSIKKELTSIKQINKKELTSNKKKVSKKKIIEPEPESECYINCSSSDSEYNVNCSSSEKDNENEYTVNCSPDFMDIDG